MIARFASGVWYAVFSVSLLFALFVSLPVAPMLKAVLTVPSLMPRIAGSARTTMRNCAVSPLAYVGFVQLIVGALPTLGSDGQLQPAGIVID